MAKRNASGPGLLIRIGKGGRVTRGIRFRGPKKSVKVKNRGLFLAGVASFFALVGAVIYVNRRRRSAATAVS
jgi:hypothetical protein